MSAALEIHKLLYDTLRLDNGLTTLLSGAHVYDDLPDRVAPPYIILGSLESLDWSTASEGGEEHFLEIEVWSDKSGRKQAIELAGYASQALASLSESLPSTTDNHVLINLTLENTFSERVENGRFTRRHQDVQARLPDRVSLAATPSGQAPGNQCGGRAHHPCL